MSILQTLGAQLAEQTKTLSSLLDKYGVQQPGFDEANAGDFEDSTSGLKPEEDVEVRQLRADIINSARQLQDLTSGPTDQILALNFSSADLQNLGVLAQFNIPQNVPLGGTISGKDLAEKINLPLDTLLRQIRFAIGTGIFTEPAPEVFAHSSVSARLAQNEHLFNIVKFSMLDMVPVHIRVAESLKMKQKNNWEHPIAAFNTAHPEVEDAFEYFQKNPESDKRYHGYLNGRINTSRWTTDKFVKAWDWAGVGDGLIIDVGGSVGHSCFAIADVAPQAKFLVQDFSIDGLEIGRKMADGIPSIKDRISFEEYDFFKPQTVTGDVYIFRHIIHDWDDEDSIKIFKSQVPALKDGSRILISEGVMPEGAAKRSAVLDDKQIRSEDILMLAVHNARERSVSQYTKLLKAASPNFELVGVTGGEYGTFQSLIEYVYRA